VNPASYLQAFHTKSSQVNERGTPGYYAALPPFLLGSWQLVLLSQDGLASAIYIAEVFGKRFHLF